MQYLYKLLAGYQKFRDKYVKTDQSVMSLLADHGQKPKIMVIACCDSRVDPALLLQCDPGDLFVVRNVANIVPPCELDDSHHGTSAALEFAVKGLKVHHIIILGHSQCGGIINLLNPDKDPANHFINNWVDIVASSTKGCTHPDECAKEALKLSAQNCLTFPWIKERVEKEELYIHQWFFDIKAGEIMVYEAKQKEFVPLMQSEILLAIQDV